MVRIKVNNVDAAGLSAPKVSGRQQAACVAPTAEAFSHESKTFVNLSTAVTVNPLVGAVHHAFANHVPLELSPDVVFNTILQGVSAHVATNPEKFRAAFVAHAGKKTLVTRDDSLRRGEWGNRWDASIDDLGRQIMGNMSGGNAKRVLATRFTTTTPAEATAHTAVFMDVVKHYYEYDIMTCCGIPWVDIAGTKADWALISQAVQPLLLDLGLSEWNKDLQLILAQFVRAFDGQVDQAHWNQIYNHFGPQGSGGVSKVSGWIAKLFLYIRGGMNPLIGVPSGADPREKKAERQQQHTEPRQPRHGFEARPWLDDTLWGPDNLLSCLWGPGKEKEKEEEEEKKKEKSRVSVRAAAASASARVPLADFPVGVTATPFTWEYLGTRISMKLVAGLVGVTVTAGGALRPEVGWIVASA